MKIVYLLQHSYEREGREETKDIGVFSTRAKARKAVKRLRSKPGFKRYSSKFNIDPYGIDQIGWENGFKTYTYKSTIKEKKIFRVRHGDIPTWAPEIRRKHSK